MHGYFIVRLWYRTSAYDQVIVVRPDSCRVRQVNRIGAARDYVRQRLAQLICACTEKPRVTKFRKVLEPTRPRAPTSKVRSVGVHFCSAISDIKPAYRASLRICAASMPSSAGHVSSSKITVLESEDQSTASGRSSVEQIAGGNTNCNFQWLANSSRWHRFTRRLA